jgi:hypothetical protein
MGSVKVKPTLVHDHSVDQWYKYVLPFTASSNSHTSRRLGPYENERNVTGEIRIQITFEQFKVNFSFPSTELCTFLSAAWANSQNDL